MSIHQGKVHNPTGEGVRAISAQAKAKAAKHAAATSDNEKSSSASGGGGGGGGNGGGGSASDTAGQHETRVGKEGTAKRNITRKKTADRDTGNYNSAYKKQGGHGKGDWKDVMDPSYVEEIPIDEKDPLYDAAEDSEKYILSSIDGQKVNEVDKRGYDPGTAKAVYGPMLTKSEFKHQVADCLKEYFDSCDADEVIRTLQELGCREYHGDVVKKAISLALDKGPRERELISRLLTCLHPVPLSHDDMEMGFQALLDSLDDLSTDVPEAKVTCLCQ